MQPDIKWVAVDWGTSNLRAWGIGADDAVVFARASGEGMGRLEASAYPETLTRLLGDTVAADGAGVDVLICGMAGARQGWREAPYLEVPADLGGIAMAAVAPPMPSSRLVPRILPGVCQKQAGAEDVMRGEETQLLGLSTLLPGFSGLVVMPGTHSKWAILEGRRLTRFSTSMTGEIYEVLRRHSVLRHSTEADDDAAENGAGFEAGLAAGLDSPGRLTALLFKVRAGSLLKGRSASWSSGLLSGLLIGAEIGGQRDWLGDAVVPLVGGSTLCGLYARGLELIGARTQTIDASEATLAGLRAARDVQRQRNHD